MRLPGARLVPGAADGNGNGNGRRGGSHRGPDADDSFDDAFDTGPIVIPRDPDAVRSSIGNHFGGVRAGRSHARETDHE